MRKRGEGEKARGKEGEREREIRKRGGCGREGEG